MKKYFIPIIALSLIIATAITTYLLFQPKPTFPADTTIVKSLGIYAYQNAVGEFKTQFKKTPFSSSSIVFSNDLGKISFYTPANQSFGQLALSSSPISSSNTLTYPNVYPDVDLRYTISTSRLLEEFIVKTKDTAIKIDQIDQIAKTTSSYHQNEDGSITFTRDNQTSFTLPRPIMYETQNMDISSTGIAYAINQKDGNLIITKVITEEGKTWLSASDRIYPIAIDLVIDNADTSSSWVSSDTTFTPVAQETTLKKEGTGSVKINTTAETTVASLDLMEYSSSSLAQSTYIGENSNTVIASGGTMSILGSDKIHTFTGSDTLNVLEGGSNVQSLIVAGGGGGGAGCVGDRCSPGAGGAGGLIYNNSQTLASSSYPITIGGGGAPGANGQDSLFADFTAVGGGHGAVGRGTGSPSSAGEPGGSGGGAGSGEAQWCVSVGSGVAGQGYAGGKCNGITNGGSGGGAGGPAISTTPGPGYISSITGSSITYSTGGSKSQAIAGPANSGNGGGTQYNITPDITLTSAGGSGIVVVRYPATTLQSYAESTIKTEGSYSLKGYAEQTTSLNKSLTRTLSSPINLTSHSSVSFDLRASRTGSNIKIGLHDVGGTTTEITPNITSADAFQAVTLDLSSVATANKDAIDKIIITIVNANAPNTFYLDNLATHYLSLGDTVTRTISPADLSSTTNLSFWVYSPKVGSFFQIELGESNSNEQSKIIEINSANTWELKTWDISSIPSASRNAITKVAFRLTADTNGSPLYFDNIESLTVPSVPTAGTPTSLSDTSIRWNFTDNAYNEQGVRVFDPNGAVTTIDSMEYATTPDAYTAYQTSSTVAVGGTITNITGYRVHTFLSSGSLTFISPGNIEALVVGGGAGTDYSWPRSGGGGGGGVTQGTYSTTTTTHTVTVGAGGVGSAGGSSSLGSLVTSAGGSLNVGKTGGASGNSYAGGGFVSDYASGGGGGAGGVGQSGYTYWDAGAELSRPHGGNGGVGIASSINGVTTYYGGGGGGSSSYYSAGSGQSGGGNGAPLNGLATAGTNNTGGGAGGSAAVDVAGGSGIVIVRYPTPSLEASSEPSLITEGSHALKVVASQTTSLNQTLTRSLNPINLSDNNYFTFEMRASRTGSNIKIGLRDSGGVVSEFTPNITAADTFQNVSFDISSINNSNKDAINQIIVTITNANASNTFYLDYLRATVSGDDVTTCVGVDRTYCDETSLTPNTQYSRKILAYNQAGESSGSTTAVAYTLAAVPPAPTASNRTSSSVQLFVSKGTNPSGTLLAIYRVENSTTCNGTGGVYIAATDGSTGASAVWQADTTWGNMTIPNLSSEKTYSFCVKAKNANGVETSFSAIGSKDSTYIPIAGDFICTEGNISSAVFTNRYIDGNTPGRYVLGLDKGTSTTNSAIFEARSCTLTLNSTDTLVTGSLKLTGGSIAIAQGAQIKIGQPLYVVDADSDGYVNTNKVYFGTPPVGARRKNLVTTLASNDGDCDDTSATNSMVISPAYIDSDGDGYGYGPLMTCGPRTGGSYSANNLDCNDSTTAIRKTSVTGGTITTSGGYKIHTFTSSSTLTVSCPSSLSTETLVIAGGGGGANAGSGGGAGGYVYNSAYVIAAGAFPITVGGGGAGGVGTQVPGTKGGNSIFSTITAEGGGAGVSHFGSAGGNGGSGGGGPIRNAAPASTGGTASQGYPGGAGMVSASWAGTSGGGGGAGGAGQQAGNTSTVKGDGGIGLANSISGASVTYAGGGGAGEIVSTRFGLGGSGIGGNGVVNNAGTAGATNTGSGGGGGSYLAPNYFNGGNGGSGIVIVRYLDP